MIKAIGVNPQQPMHPLDEVCARGFGHQVKVVAHQAPGVHLPVGFLASLRQCPDKERAVVVTQNGKRPVRCSNLRASSHIGSSLGGSARTCGTSGLTPRSGGAWYKLGFQMAIDFIVP